MARGVARRPRRKDIATPQQVRPRDVYSDLLAEAGPAGEAERSDERPLKRPRVAGRRIQAVEQPKDTVETVVSSPKDHDASSIHNTPAQSEIGDEGMDDDDNGHSDLEFEDVVLEQQASSPAQSEEVDQDITIDVPTVVRQSKANRRNTKPRVEKATRILTHKAHLVTLLGHCMIANTRCNDRAVQRRMKRLLHPSVRKLLTPAATDSQFQRNHSLMNGLQRAVDAFKGTYRVTSSGMMRSVWRDPDETAAVLSAEIATADFQSLRDAAKSLSGSQDVGAQLFCAMLRSIGVAARLVCSLQVLPLSTAQAKQVTRQKQSNIAMTITAGRTRLDHAHTQHSQTDSPRSRNKAVSRPLLAYPVFWIEVFDAAYQKWISVDAIVTRTIRKPTKIEPPASYALNQMSYVIAFSADGAAKDVTRRYAKSYNAKTRRTRLEACGSEELQWLRKLMRMFQPAVQSSDDATIEDAELHRREASEGLPSNILDFVSHPIYALERHLKRHEVIHPRREVGKVNAGTAAKPKMEQVFRRQDVHLCRTSDQWFRLGRTLKPGLQPLKFVPARSRTIRNLSESDDDETPATVGLYTLAQTELYIPTPVSRGKIPRNGFGNIDVYVPSMVPAGASHVRHELAKHASSILGVDAADAVVGFKFANRKGVAVIEGAVIPTRYLDAINTVIEGLEWETTLGQCYARSLLSLRLWKKFLQGSKIRERVAAYRTQVEDETGQEELVLSELTDDIVQSHSDEPLYTAGQYDEPGLTDLVNAPKFKPVARAPRKIISDSSSASEDEDYDTHLAESRRGSFLDTFGTQESFTNAAEAHPRVLEQIKTSEYDVGSGGGFLADDEDEHETITMPRSLDHLPSRIQDNTASTYHLLPENDDSQHELSHSVAEAQLDATCSTTESPSRTIEHGISPSHHEVDRTIANENQDQHTDSERGSRLSHDPEDEDADPDWIVSD